MLSLLAKEGVRVRATIGEYFDTETKIEVVAVRDDGSTDAGLAIWDDLADLGTAAQNLDSQIRRYPNARNATIIRRLFLRSWKGKTKPVLAGVKIITLKELYELKPAATRKA